VVRTVSKTRPDEGVDVLDNLTGRRVAEPKLLRHESAVHQLARKMCLCAGLGQSCLQDWAHDVLHVLLASGRSSHHILDCFHDGVVDLLMEYQASVGLMRLFRTAPADLRALLFRAFTLSIIRPSRRDQMPKVLQASVTSRCSMVSGRPLLCRNREPGCLALKMHLPSGPTSTGY